MPQTFHTAPRDHQTLMCAGCLEHGSRVGFITPEGAIRHDDRVHGGARCTYIPVVTTRTGERGVWY